MAEPLPVSVFIQASSHLSLHLISATPLNVTFGVWGLDAGVFLGTWDNRGPMSAASQTPKAAGAAVTANEIAQRCRDADDPITCLFGVISRTKQGRQSQDRTAFIAYPQVLRGAGLQPSETNVAVILRRDCEGADPELLLKDIERIPNPSVHRYPDWDRVPVYSAHGDLAGTTPRGPSEYDTEGNLTLALPRLWRAAHVERPDLIAATAFAAREAGLIDSASALRTAWVNGNGEQRRIALTEAERRALDGGTPAEALLAFKLLYLSGEQIRARTILDARLAAARLPPRDKRGRTAWDVVLMLLWEGRFAEADSVADQPVGLEQKVLADIESGRGLAHSAAYLAARSADDRYQAYSDCASQLAAKGRVAEARACQKLAWEGAPPSPEHRIAEDLLGTYLAQRAMEMGQPALAADYIRTTLWRWSARAEQGVAPAPLDGVLVERLVDVFAAAVQYRRPELACVGGPRLGATDGPPDPPPKGDTV